MSLPIATEGKFPAMTSEAVDKARQAEQLLLSLPQVDIPTDHVFHAGMYSRTICIPAGVGLTGALIKRPTTLVFSGKARVFLGDGWVELDGHYVIPASAGRKQVFIAIEDTWLTMSFPTDAKTVEEAEAEFTDEAELLFSRHGMNHVTITGE